MNDNNDSAQNSAPAKSQSLAIPVAIIVGFALIASAIYFSGNKTNQAEPVVENEDLENQVVDNNVGGEMNPVTEKDHIRGNPNAPIMLVEYSDYDCPFCKVFHETMGRIMDEYGTGGQVAWVYRQYPIQSLHPSAPRIAEASECVAKLGGNDAFWTFSDLVFNEREVNALTNMTRMDEFAEKSGVDVAAFNSCLDNSETRADVEEDFNNGVSMGINGTPHTIIMIGDQQFPIKGAQPYENVKNIIDQLLKQLEGSSDEGSSE